MAMVALPEVLFAVCCDLRVKKNHEKPPENPQKNLRKPTKATNKTVHSAHSLSLSCAITEQEPSEGYFSANFKY